MTETEYALPEDATPADDYDPNRAALALMFVFMLLIVFIGAVSFVVAP